MHAALIKYDLGKGVEAFSTRRESVLPYPVIQGHQVHGSRVAVIDRPGTSGVAASTPTPPLISSPPGGKASNAEGSSTRSG